MKTKLVRIGNDWAVVLPDEIVAQAGLLDEVEVVTDGKQVHIQQAQWNPVETWDEAFNRSILEGNLALKAGDW